MQIHDATSSDLAAIAEIQAASPQASTWNPADYLNYDCHVAVVGDAVAGFVVSRSIAEGEREILNVAVAPKHRRNGIGRALIADELSRQRGTWFLEVRESNRGAISLYIAMGFAVVGRRLDYYSLPSESGIVMRFFS